MWERQPETRQGMWEVIRSMKQFTRKDIAKATGHNRRTITSFLELLERGGYIKTIHKGRGVGTDQTLYRLIRDAGNHFPRLGQDGKKLPPGERQRMWSALKVMGYSPFDWRDLSLVARAENETTKEYCRFLEHGGYLRLVRKGDAHRTAKYLFVRAMDTGLLTPEIHKRKTEVFDVNRQEIVWKKGHVLAQDVKTGKMVWVKGGEQ